MGNFCQASVFFKFIDCFQQSDILEKKKNVGSTGPNNWLVKFSGNIYTESAWLVVSIMLGLFKFFFQYFKFFRINFFH